MLGFIMVFVAITTGAVSYSLHSITLQLTSTMKKSSTHQPHRHFTITLVNCILSTIILSIYGLQWISLPLLIFTWLLLCCAIIDVEHYLLPDSLNYLLLWIGLTLSINNVFVATTDAILGAMAGYLSLWLFTYSYQWFSGKLGMGHGDFKLFAACGAWFGWKALASILLVASLSGAVVGLLLLVTKKITSNSPIAFGPHLCFSAWLYACYFPYYLQ